jgi:hypothetical protein
MKNLIALMFCSLTLPSCVIVPQTDHVNVNRCEISSDKKTLKFVDGFNESNTFYSIGGFVLAPISGVFSGSYVALNNVYNLGEELIVCGIHDNDIGTKSKI